MSHCSEAPSLRIKPDSRHAGTATGTSRRSRCAALYYRGAPRCPSARDTARGGGRGRRLAHGRSRHRTDTATVRQSANARRSHLDFLLILGFSPFSLKLQTKSGEMFSLFIERFCSHHLDGKITRRTGFHSFSCFDSVKEMLSVSNGILNQPSPCTHFKIA